MTEVKTHDPQAVLDYRWDWSAWLDDGDTISGKTVTVASGDVTVNQGTIASTGTTVTAWISGGTPGTAAQVVCHITTVGGRQDDRTLYLNVRNQ